MTKHSCSNGAGESAAVLKAPFPWFGGKSRVAHLVWPRLGPVKNYIEPFFGSGAVFFGRPDKPQIETINDADGFVVNFWRAVKNDPASVITWADQPVFECDLHARHTWLLERKQTLVAQLEGNPDFYDAKIAGWWCWASCLWIGSGFLSGRGPWQLLERDGSRVLVKSPRLDQPGVSRQRPHLGDAGRGILRPSVDAKQWLKCLAERLRHVRVCCGDWARVLGPAVTTHNGLTGVFLDAPYLDTERCPALYRLDAGSVAAKVREWALANGDNPKMRICLCGYAEEHERFMPTAWECVAWDGPSGYAVTNNQNGNRYRERLWFSPHCLKPA